MDGSETVAFTRMEDGTAADYALLDRTERDWIAGTPERLLAALQRLEGSMSGYQVSRLEHSLQTATRAWRDGADADWIVAALLHDLGDELAPLNHGALAASVLRPYVRAEVAWTVEMHPLFQRYYYAHHLGGDRHARERYRAHPHYRACVDFCARWDQAAFDPAYESKPLAFFEPVLREVLARPAWEPAVTGEPRAG